MPGQGRSKSTINCPCFILFGCFEVQDIKTSGGLEAICVLNCKSTHEKVGPRIKRSCCCIWHFIETLSEMKMFERDIKLILKSVDLMSTH